MPADILEVMQKLMSAINARAVSNAGSSPKQDEEYQRLRDKVLNDSRVDTEAVPGFLAECERLDEVNKRIPGVFMIDRCEYVMQNFLPMEWKFLDESSRKRLRNRVESTGSWGILGRLNSLEKKYDSADQ